LLTPPKANGFIPNGDVKHSPGLAGGKAKRSRTPTLGIELPQEFLRWKRCTPGNEGTLRGGQGNSFGV